MAGPLPLIAGRAPETVYVPESLAELRDIVVGASDGPTLVPAGGRTQLELGFAPSGPFSLLDVSQALRNTAAGTTVEHQRDDLTAVVAAGDDARRARRRPCARATSGCPSTHRWPNRARSAAR